MNPEIKPETQSSQKETFVETALKLGGKSEEEARKTGELDRADDQLDQLFDPKYQTTNSPIHRIVWGNGEKVKLDDFSPHPISTEPATQKVMDASYEVVRKHVAAKTLRDANNKISDTVFEELSAAGYWGMLVDKKYGGQGAPFRVFSRFLADIATVDPTVAGLASVHGCIGAVDPISAFGNEAQKQKYLPMLADGRKLSGFALTEPCAGSDLTALKTTAVKDGNDYVVNGEKLFITNAIPGRLIGLVVKIDNVPAVLIAELPPQENEHFYTKKYGLYALKHSYNNGLIFKDFRIPVENKLHVEQGDGLTIAYHGLNRGRVALCANAAGTMRMMMANMLPWGRFRKTYGNAIDQRELVRRRLGRLAALITGADALTDWCSWLLDEGYRGEMECIIAKIFGSEAQKEAAIELFMKTHGGRSFLHGHLFGDNVHEFLAPCIYEGEGEMLGMAFLKSLIKQHGKEYYEPIGRALSKAGIKQPNMLNPAHMWALKEAVIPYLTWRLKQLGTGWGFANCSHLPAPLGNHAEFALEALERGRFLVDGLMQKHQLKLADRQCEMAEVSQQIQNMVTIVVTCLWASAQKNELITQAADILCQDLIRNYSGRKPSSKYYKSVTKLGATIAEGGFPGLEKIMPEEILMKY
jgi:alkylation response protein AidB-like acyl-CoA dehydrogenase